ncbi:MFS transporter [Lentzea tibetensis]|nr:MFS transporter [Lentzea tibetensis]
MEKAHLRDRAAVPVLTTAAMTSSMLPLFLLGALAPALVTEFGIARPLLGVLVTAGFGVAAALSLMIGPVVDAVGPRRSVIALFAASAVALAVFSSAPHYAVLVVAVAIGGVPQALANPSTNKLIATAVPPPRRPVLLGIKQSGVQLGAFVAGLPLAWLADAVDWRVAVGVPAGCAALAAVASLVLPHDTAPVRVPTIKVSLAAEPVVWLLAGFSVLLGCGIAAVNTYVALFATQELSYSAPAAAGLVAVLGVVGIAGRIWWARVVSAGRQPMSLLAPLALVAAAAPVLLLAANAVLAWLAVAVVGACAVAANAVSVLAVVGASTPAQLGRNSALVAAGFFAGFAVGPPLFGLLVEVSGSYSAGWALVAAECAAAAAVVKWSQG